MHIITVHIPRRYVRKRKSWTIAGLHCVPLEFQLWVTNWVFRHSTIFLYCWVNSQGNICVTNEQSCSACCHHNCSHFSWHITGFVTRVARRVPHVEQKLFNFPEHLSPSPIFSEDGAARSFVFYVLFVLSLSGSVLCVLFQLMGVFKRFNIALSILYLYFGYYAYTQFKVPSYMSYLTNRRHFDPQNKAISQ